MLSLFFLFSGGIAVFGQQYQSEVPGDNFSLEGALELFKKSASPEEFERMLNDADSKVNNLDLNGDGDIDYIRVINHQDGNVHAFILQAVISDTESQDVAVIELEKLANGKAILQITGDEDVYGIQTIIEPTEEVRVNAGTGTARTVVNVWAWPSVQYVYSPGYVVWVSPWHWHLRPIWWRSWRPVVYYDYYTWWQPYRPFYARCHSHRIVYAQQIYRPHRRSSAVVYTRHQSQLTHYRSTHRRDDRSSNNRSSYTGGRSGRYEDSRSYRDGNTSQRTPGVRERSTSFERTNSRTTTNTRSQEMERSDINKRSTTKQYDASPTNRSFERSKAPAVSQQNSSVKPRSQAPAQRSGSMSPSRSTQSRESRPVMKSSDKSSSGGSTFKRSSGSGGSKKRD